TDRVAAEGADSRNTDGFRFDTTVGRALDDVTAADQGNRDEDRMVGEGDDVDEVSQLAGSDADAAGTDRDLADPDSVGAGESGQLSAPAPGPRDGIWSGRVRWGLPRGSARGQRRQDPLIARPA